MAAARKKKLRIHEVTIAVSLLWDDGSELTPAPAPKVVTLPLSAAKAFLRDLPTGIKHAEAELAREDTDDA